MGSDRRAAVAVAPPAAEVADRKTIDRATPSRVPTRLLTNLPRLLQAMAQIRTPNVSVFYLTLKLEPY